MPVVQHVRNLIICGVALCMMMSEAPALQGASLETLLFNGKSDTSSVRTPDITVEASRIRQDRLVVQSVLGRLSSTELNAEYAQQCVDVLRLLPGVYVKDYGGLGGVKTVALRGASAAQTAVSLDGVLLNSSQNALVDFSALPLSMIGSIETQEAADLSASPAHAIGGELCLRSPEPVRTNALRTELSLGSWNDLAADAQFQLVIDSAQSLRANISLRRAEGNYPFRFDNFGVSEDYVRENADLKDLHAAIAHTIQRQDFTLRSSAFLRSTLRGAPGAVLQGVAQTSTARLQDQDVLLIGHLEFPACPRHEVHINTFVKYGAESYSDSDRSLLGHPIDNRFYAREAGLHLIDQVATVTGSMLTLQADLCYSDLRGDLLRSGSSGWVRRSTSGLGAAYQSPAYRIDSLSEVYAFAVLRSDFASDAQPQFSPRVGVIAHFASTSTARLLLGRSYRLPSFNELYYQNYGSTDLKAEQNLRLTFSAEHLLYRDAAFRIELGCTAFISNTDDQIVATPRSPIAWSAANIAQVYIRGADLGMQLWWKQLHARASISEQLVHNDIAGSEELGKQLPYTPEQLANLSVHYIYDSLSVGLSAQWSGERFTQSDNAPESRLAGVWTLSSTLSYSFSLFERSLNVYLRLDNLLDASYVVVANYPMPGRQWRIGVGFPLLESANPKL